MLKKIKIGYVLATLIGLDLFIIAIIGEEYLNQLERGQVKNFLTFILRPTAFMIIAVLLVPYIGFIIKRRAGWIATSFFLYILFLFGLSFVVLHFWSNDVDLEEYWEIVLFLLILISYPVIMNNKDVREYFRLDSSEGIFVNNLIAVLLALPLSTFIAYEIENDNSARVVSFEEISHGIQISEGDDATFQDSTKTDTMDTIPGILGQKFGMQFRLRSKTEGYVKLEQVWILPSEMITENEERILEIRRRKERHTNEVTWTNYTLERQNEILPGVWTFKMYQGEKFLFERKFFIRVPGGD